MNEHSTIMRRIKLGNIIQVIFGVCVLILIFVSLVVPSIFKFTFVSMIMFIFFQPLEALFLTILNHKTMQKESREISPDTPLVIQFSIHNREIRRFISFLSKKNDCGNGVYNMKRLTGYEIVIYYSLPMEKQVSVNFIEWSRNKLTAQKLPNEVYTIAMLGHEEELSPDELGKGIDAMMYQKENDIILTCRVYSTPSTSKELHVLHRLAGKLTKKIYNIRLYGNVYFIKHIIETYYKYRKL